MVDEWLNLYLTASHFDQVQLALNGVVYYYFIYLFKRKKGGKTEKEKSGERKKKEKKEEKSVVYLSLVQRKTIKNGIFVVAC